MNKTRVIIVGEEDDVTQSIAFALEANDVRVSRASSSEASLAQIADEPPGGVLVCDKRPELDAVEIVRRLRSEGISCPLVVISDGLSEARRRALSSDVQIVEISTKELGLAQAVEAALRS